MEYPKVLIIGETFHLNAGGGITMTNLFREWPSERIGVITDRISETNIHSSYSYYQLGEEEMRFPFPFNLLQTRVKSGEYHFRGSGQNSKKRNNHSGLSGGVKKKARCLMDNILKKSGLTIYFYKIGLSDKLIKWILDFKPDIMYVQPFLHRIMRFGNLLHQELEIPYAVHIMDDSITFINRSIIFHNRVQRMIERDSHELIAKASVHMCISESMAAEYKLRYGKSFLAFRNPIEIERWLPYQKKDLSVDINKLKIIYTGRLFSPTYDSLLDMCRVVHRFNNNGKHVILDVFTHDDNLAFSDAISNLSGINLKTPIDITEMPQLVQQYDIFFLCLDFDDYARKYSQYSISTRTSEGMISSVPILMYGPQYSAQYKYFEKTRSGYLVGEKSQKLLEEAINELWHNNLIRREISDNAVENVTRDNNAIIVREKFREALDIHS